MRVVGFVCSIMFYAAMLFILFCKKDHLPHLACRKLPRQWTAHVDLKSVQVVFVCALWLC
jgi:hypothetical protein